CSGPCGGGGDPLPRPPRALRRAEKHLPPHIKAGLASREGESRYRHRGAGEGDVPASGLAGAGDGLGRARQGPTPAHRNPPDLGEHQEAVVPMRTVALLLGGAGVGAPVALEAGNPGLLPRSPSAQGCLRGLVPPGEHVLAHRTVAGGVVGEGGTQVLELGFLLETGGRSALPAAPPRDPLLQRAGVERAAAPQDVLPCSLLLGRWRECVRVGLARRVGTVVLCCSIGVYSV